MAKCCDSIDIKTNLKKYLYEEYGTVCEQPWEAFPDYCTFKTANSKKWYAVIMDVKQSCIGLEGKKTVDIMNVKVKPEKIPSLIDNRHYFSAYHMNKRTWVTILLDRDTDLEELKTLIDESYNLVERPKKN